MELEKALMTVMISSLCILLIVLAPRSSSQAQDASGIHIVRGRGAIVLEDQSKARQKAIALSLRYALERAGAGLLDPDANISHLQVLKQRIYQRAPQYIRSYRVLWEYPDLQQQVYRVELEVEVALKAVAQAISRLGLNRSNRGTLN
ncbi:MAG: hypothetical protein ETSY1_17210 [Candidatus Entotheonella factor]|uniref:Uncharacterized protein n=1 Tax=Entotheonella factor TaxID=1429438 RepID=W4LLR7_ENTF1|nr:MAG: hypothetical protein ETSY1_17210 [Candidatus Entotheonella factor]